MVGNGGRIKNGVSRYKPFKSVKSTFIFTLKIVDF